MIVQVIIGACFGVVALLQGSFGITNPLGVPQRS